MSETQTAPANNGVAKTNNLQVTTADERTLADSVMSRIKAFEATGSINIPKDYSAANALRAAYLILLETKTMDKRPVLQVCSKESIANALLKMVIQGLNPVKRQCSFIAYGNTLTMQREYQGSIAIAKRDAGLVRVHGNAVYKDDEFEFINDPETGNKKITKHVQTMQSISGEVVGAYAVKEYVDGQRSTEVMPMSQIRQAWLQGPTKGQSPAHKNFPDQMAIKTVINRALKIDINSSDDSALMDDDSEMMPDDVRTSHVKYEIGEHANKKEIGFDDHQSVDDANMPKDENVDQQTGEVLDNAENAGPGF